MPPSWFRLPTRVPPELEEADWSGHLKDPHPTPFSDALISQLSLTGDVSAFAYDPVQGYLALGTTNGCLHLLGGTIRVSWALRPAVGIRHLAFRSGTGLLIVADQKDNLSVFDISRADPSLAPNAGGPSSAADSSSTTRIAAGIGPTTPGDALHPDTPMRIHAHSARNSVTCIETQPGHAHLWIGLRDGTVDAYDLDRLHLSAYRIPNLWWEEEEILRKSGVPDAPSRRHVPMVIDIKTHPLDLGRVLLAYEGGACLLDVKTRAVIRSFQLRLLPGAPGAGGAPDEILWTERASPATCVAWRPDGIIFAMGHADGVVSFWNVDDGDKPLLVRTLDQIDVDRPQAPSGDAHSQDSPSRFMREPIFKLAWSGFSSASWRDFAAQGTALTVLGGGVVDASSGVVSWHFPAYSAPVQLWASKTPEALAKLRNSLRSSIITEREARIQTKATCEDFLLLPAASPHYGNAFDATALLALIGSDPSLPPLQGATRGLQAFPFPAAAPTEQGLHIAGSKTSAAEELELPFSLAMTGSSAAKGVRLAQVGLHAYRKLVSVSSKSDPLGSWDAGVAEELARQSAADRHSRGLPLQGGEAHPTALNGATLESLLRESDRLSAYKIIVSWHHDGTIRFADASPHLLLKGRIDLPPEGSDPVTHPLPQPVLEEAFPKPLHHLTISLQDLVHGSHAGRQHAAVFARLRASPSRMQILDVHFAPDALEIGVVLAGGALLHYRFDFANASETEAIRAQVAQEAAIDEEAARKFAEHTSEPPSAKSVELSKLDDAMRDVDLRDMPGPTSPSQRAEVQAPSSAPGLNNAAMSRSGSHASAMAPPPRPRRDPKRLSVMPTSPPSAQNPAGASRVRQDDHISAPVHGTSASSTPLPVNRQIEPVGNFADWSQDGFKANLLIDLSRGGITAAAVSDVGFIAIAYGAALAIIDLRIADIIYREGFGDGSDTPALSAGASSKEGKEYRKLVEEESADAISLLRLSMARTIEHNLLAPQLLVLRPNRVGIRTFLKAPNEWIVTRTGVATFDDLHTPVDAYVLDSKGRECGATPLELRQGLREQDTPDDDDPERHEIHSLVLAGEQNIYVRAGVTGAKLAKVNVGERILRMQIVERFGQHVCMASTLSSTQVYSLPHLQHVVRLPSKHRRDATATAAVDGQLLAPIPVSFSMSRSGDVIELGPTLQDLRLSTLLGNVARPGVPALDLYSPTKASACPHHPGAVTAAVKGVTSWLSGKSSAIDAGSQLDELLAGTTSGKRPEAPKLPEPKHVQMAAARELEIAERLAAREEAEARKNGVKSGGQSVRQPPPPRTLGERHSETVARETRDARNAAANARTAAEERGQLMGG
ncbi:Tomosyn and related SNARE-interacting proteins [Ceraceosorus bombacis]|uniref:Tomosyn and related SNARE-interacting proteins n=1 Tax=Ceraceosorus bombacis TaxID=401625 RepID=A0A0P1BP57_9BASI|nr:Tomosyn and related SNARE-interacting proteins [Ceraceosorus bombacis]